MTPFTLVAASLYGILFVVLLCCLWTVWRSNRAATWPTARGVIASCKLEETEDTERNAFYTVKVRYAYSVQDQRYTGTRLAIGYSGSGSRDTQRAIVQRLKQAAAVEVRYDPEDPSSAVLSYGTHLSHKRSLGAVFVIFLLLTGIIVMAWITMKPDTGLLDHLVTFH